MQPRIVSCISNNHVKWAIQTVLQYGTVNTMAWVGWRCKAVIVLGHWLPRVQHASLATRGDDERIVVGSQTGHRTAMLSKHLITVAVAPATTTRWSAQARRHRTPGLWLDRCETGRQRQPAVE